MALQKPGAILFDLDGTLVDSVPDLANALDSALEMVGLPATGQGNARNWVGNGIERLVKRGLTGDLQAEPDPALFEQTLKHFRQAYEAHNGQASVLFPGVLSGLQKFHEAGIPIGVVTNKATQFTGPLLEALGVANFFGVVVCGDTLAQSKPEPEPLWYGIEQLGAKPETSWMVGDSRHDMAAARAAGMKAIAVPYGYNHGESVEQAGPDLLVPTIEALADQLLGA